MITVSHQFVFELFHEDGSPAGEGSPDIDWEPAVEWTRFRSIVAPGPQFDGRAVSVSIRPQWSEPEGQPHVAGFRVQLAHPSARETAHTFPGVYFRSAAQTLATEFVQRGKLCEGEHFTYRVCAYPAPALPDRHSLDGFGITVADPVVLLTRRPIGPLMDRSEIREADQAASGDVPVFVPAHVVEEAAQHALAKSDEEVGGVLIGHVCVDPDTNTPFVEVTAQIPAVHTHATSTRLTFTPETWSAVDSAVRLRSRGEIWIGWHHSHPAKEWCKNCDLERKKVCPMSRNFFSAQDIALHRTVFARAHSIALVVTETDFGVNLSMFGWRDGIVKSRAFHVLENTATLAY